MVKNDKGVVQDRWFSQKLTRAIRPIEPSAFFIKPVVFYPEFTAQDQLTTQNIKKIQDYVNQQMRNTVNKYFVVVDKPQVGAFIIAPAITKMKISLEGLSPLEVLPFKAVLSGINYAIGGRDRDVEVRLENKVSLAITQEPLAEIVFRGDALQLENDSEQLTKAHVRALLDSWITQWDKNLSAYKTIIDKREHK